MESNPHPEHTDCPVIAQAGFLNPNQSRQTGNLNVAMVRGFHDHSVRWRDFREPSRCNKQIW